MLRIEDSHFKDEDGRTLMLRGVNLGGSSKVPSRPDGATYRRDGFFDHRQVSFVGRPFPLEDADEHFTRLRAWGFTFLRFLVTWEAIEHSGPGIYDEAYLDYVRDIVIRAREHGIRLFIDPHQDVWSRFSGGDGAPGWTLEAVGFDITRFAETGAAIVHATHGDPFPMMIWPTNASKLAAATMFTLFFGGNDFAPETKINGEPAQDFLQRHYINAIRQVALRLQGLDNVVGYDTMNEPLSGYIGHADLNTAKTSMGLSPSPFQGMLLGAGIPQEVPFWALRTASVKKTHHQRLNPTGQYAWLDGHGCVWRQHGVWDSGPAGAAQLLRPDHFSRVRGRRVDFAQDYYLPFAKRFAAAIRSVDPHAMIFVEIQTAKPPPRWDGGDAGRVVYAPHWYDGLVLVKKNYHPFIAIDFHNYNPVFGARAIRKSFADQLARFKQHASDYLGGAPTLLGEFGIPFDMRAKKAFRNGDFGLQTKALDRTFQAIEANLLDCTLWNYTADNTNARGDLWNDEDLSLFSRDQQDNPADIHSGGRALRAAVRPYPVATAGEPLRLKFDLRRRRFEFTFRHDPDVTGPTEIYLPDIQYPQGCHVQVSDGTFELHSEQRMLIYHHGLERREHTVRIRPGG
ncbi:MAG: cellulase family glycosylhydrolase [Chloroflexota bacterium]